jgi:Tfp pilus assembly protein PilV
MLAILLLTTGLAATTFLFSRGIFATSDAEEMEQAVALAQEKMEGIRGASFASIAGESKAAVSGWSGFSREVTVTDTSTNLKQVVVTVYWNTVDGELSRSLTSHVANVSNN